VQHEYGSWRIRMNQELNELIENADRMRFIKSRMIAFLGYVTRMDEKRITKRLLEWKPKAGELEEDQGKDGLRTLNKIYRGWELDGGENNGRRGENGRESL